MAVILHSQETIDRYTAAGFWGDRTLLDIFDDSAKAHPDRPAVMDPPDRSNLTGMEPETVTYAELSQAVNAIATALLRAGLQKDDVVMVQLPNTWELAALYLAVTRAGGTLSPVPIQWRAKDVGYVRELTKSDIFITLKDFKGFGHLEMGERLGFRNLISLEELRDMAKGDVDEEALSAVTTDPNDVFSLCWTSGTEAEPKGCPLTHNNWIYQSGNLVKGCSMEKGDRILCLAPLVNMAAVGVNYVPWLLTGGTFILHHPINPKVLLGQLMQADVQFTILVPAVLNMLVQLENVDQIDLSSIRTITSGSAPPAPSVMEEYQRRWGIEVVNVWGQNEGTALITDPPDVPEPAMRSDHFPWWGKKGIEWPSGVEGMEVKVLGEDGEELTEPGSIGELVYKGPNVFSGYFNRPDLDETSFTEDGFFRTGDLFLIQDERHLGFHDRKKDIVIRGGTNISSAEVENAVQAHPKVSEAGVIPVPDARLGERVGVFVVPADASDPPTLREISGFLKEQGYAAYKAPERLELVEVLPRNPVGKILKSDLREELRNRMEEGQD